MTIIALAHATPFRPSVTDPHLRLLLQVEATFDGVNKETKESSWTSSVRVFAPNGELILYSIQQVLSSVIF